MTEYSPTPRELVAVVFDLWKEDDKLMSLSYGKILARIKEAKKEDHWVLSEKRLKTILKEFNLQPNNEQQKKTFLKETVSTIVPNRVYPTGVEVRMSKGKGKIMVATKSFKAGEKMWEERPLLPPADVDKLSLKRKGLSCSFCSKAIRLGADGKPLPRTGVACLNCTINWCSNNCKRDDVGHQFGYHEIRTFKPQVNSKYMKLYESYCLENELTAGYAVGSFFLHKLKLGQNSEFVKIVSSMATVKQSVKAASVIDEKSFEYEQYIEQLRGAYNLLAQALQPVYKLSFDEYLLALGTFNLNNVENCMFEYYANLNHSCEPNITFKFKNDSRGDGIIVTAKQDIAAGEELTTTYVNLVNKVDDRQHTLRQNWGFNCACARCKREKNAVPPPSQPAKSVLKDSNSPTSRRKSVHFEPSIIASTSN